MSAIKRAGEIVGSQKTLAELLGVSPGAVSQWVDGEVPINHCIPIEKLTNGAVRCEELNHNQDWSYLRATDCPTVSSAPAVPLQASPTPHSTATGAFYS